MSDVQQQVQKAFDYVVDSGTRAGLQVAVEVSSWSSRSPGVADPATCRNEWSVTPFYGLSVFKVAASSIADVVVERGLCGYGLGSI